MMVETHVFKARRIEIDIEGGGGGGGGAASEAS